MSANAARHQALAWHEKLPLALLMAAQALVIFRWYADGNLPPAVVGALPHVTTLIALAASVALDLAVVTTAMARRAGRRSAWGALTTGAAMLFSSLVALDVYGVFPFGAWLHAAFPVVTFFYAQHLAAAQPARHTEQEYQDALASMGAMLAQVQAEVGAIAGHIAPNGGHGQNGVSSPHNGYECPSCGAALDSAGEKGAAARYGYCRHCKPAANVSSNGHGHERIEDMEVVA